MRLHLIALTIVATLALVLVACSGDDDASDTGDDGAPTATDSPTAAPADADDDDGGDDDDAGNATDAPDFSEDFGMSEAGRGGTGTVVIGDDTFEYQVIACSRDDTSATWNGRGQTGDGTPFVAEVSVKFGFEAEAEISVGSSSVADDGDPHWTAEPTLTYSQGSNGVVILRYDASFTSSNGDTAEGSVDVVCTP